MTFIEAISKSDHHTYIILKSLSGRVECFVQESQWRCVNGQWSVAGVKKMSKKHFKNARRKSCWTTIVRTYVPVVYSTVTPDDMYSRFVLELSNPSNDVLHTVLTRLNFRPMYVVINNF